MPAYILNKEESERLNILKYISIILVVYIHSYTTNLNFADGTVAISLPQWLMLLEDLVSQVVARCAVPMFFLISSILLFKSQRQYKKVLAGKAKTLLIPYLFWNTAWIAVFILLQSLPFTAPYFSGNNTPILRSSFAELMELYGIGLSLPSPHVYPLWFMRDLMIVTLLYPIIGKLANKFPKAVLICAAVLLLVPISFPLKQALLWFCVGAAIVNLNLHMGALDRIAMWQVTLVYVACAAITLFTEIEIVDTLFIFVGILYWTRVSKWIYDSEKIRSIFLKLSEWTFIIYAAHELTLRSLQKICQKLLPTQPVWILGEYLFLPVLVIGGCCLVGMVMKKLFPKLYAFATGAR